MLWIVAVSLDMEPQFVYMHIPKTSRFSKCNTSWEYKNLKQSVFDEDLKEASLNKYCIQLDIAMKREWNTN